MIPYTDQLPPVTVIARSAGLARYIGFEMSLTSLFTPVGSSLSRVISANLAGGPNDVIRTTSTPYYWIIDDDQQFDSFTLLRLMAHDKPVIVPTICQNKPPFHAVMYQSEEVGRDWEYPPSLELTVSEIVKVVQDGGDERDVTGRVRELLQSGARRPRKKFLTYPWGMLDTESGIKQVYACGLSGMLVKREVFEQLIDPWFELGQTNPEEVAEDVYFCEKLRKAGIPVHVDLDCVIGHYSPVAVWPVRLEDGSWTMRLTWENGQTIVVNRPDKTPVRPTARQFSGNVSSLAERARELRSQGLSDGEAFSQAMRETQETK